MKNQTITIIKNGHEHTLREVGIRPRSSQYDAFGKIITKHTPSPRYDGMKNMALVSCRKLTKSEIKALQNEPV